MAKKGERHPTHFIKIVENLDFLALCSVCGNLRYKSYAIICPDSTAICNKIYMCLWHAYVFGYISNKKYIELRKRSGAEESVLDEIILRGIKACKENRVPY